jgi:hypothetical protein
MNRRNGKGQLPAGVGSVDGKRAERLQRRAGCNVQCRHSCGNAGVVPTVQEGILQSLTVAHSRLSTVKKLALGRALSPRSSKQAPVFLGLCTSQHKSYSPMMVFLVQCCNEHVLEGAFAKKMDEKPSLSPAELVIVIHKPQNGIGGI